MDARITKSRLANLLSYDWLKILVAILAAVFAITVVFTTLKTRPGKLHVFGVYGYRELVAGSDADHFADLALSDGIFSYDILDVEYETFGTGQYSDMAFSARRAAEQGTVMFTTTTPIEEEGEPATSALQQLTGGENTRIALDLELYLSDCENYLIRFFGTEWETGSLNAEEAERCFTARNGKDARFRSAAQRAEGIEREKERLLSLRENYLAVEESLSSGKISLAYVTGEEEEKIATGFALGNLTYLHKFYYYPGEDGSGMATKNICLMLFRNDDDAGKPAADVRNDLRYEALAFLKYLIETYGG